MSVPHSRRRYLFVAASLAALLLQGAATPIGAVQQDAEYTPAPENLKAREWFQDARFGLFIHWGVYSVLGDGEWVMNNRKIRADDYEKLPAFFNPTSFDAAEWVRMVKAAGMKYITITSKHHDGFAMFDSKVSDWDIVDRTPYKKDVLKQLADECHKQGIKLFFYHSQLDWHHPDYYPRGRTGNDAARPASGTWNRYLDYMDAQLSELLTNYGEIGGIWFDGWWDRPDADWRLSKTYSLIHKLQPAALIGSNHHRKPFAGEDFQMFEKDLPGQNTAGFSADSQVGQLPLETCDTINGAWGFNLTDRRYKSAKDLIHYLVRAAGANANFLLNVGPMPSGKIQPEFVEILGQIGQWTTKYGDSIYGTRGGPIPPRQWGVTTRKGNTIYVHVLDWPDTSLLLPTLPGKIAAARLLKDGQAVPFVQQAQGVILTVPIERRDPIDTVVALELQR
jgi:alpha-L-fucosidase